MKSILVSLTLAAALLWAWVFFGDDIATPQLARPEPKAKPKVVAVKPEQVESPSHAAIDELLGIKPTKKKPPKKRLRPQDAPSAPAREAELIDVDPGLLRVVLGLAAMEGICAQGKREACTILDKEGKAGRKQLQTTRDRLAKSCGLHALKACYLRGELDFKGGRIDTAARWYAKGKVLAMSAGSRCSEKAGKRPETALSCAEIQETLSLIAQREREIADFRERGL